MKLKRFLACVFACTLVGASFVACGEEESSKEESKAETTTEATTEAAATTAAASAATAATIAPADVNVVTAGSGDAYLAITDADWWIQYWGNDDDAGSMLCYDAGVETITGNGSYTVSVDASTDAFHFDTDTGAEYKCAGIGFMSLMVRDGESTNPGMVLTIDSILVDGVEVEMAAKNYTSSDDGIETRSNIYNPYITAPSEDARSTEGNLFDESGAALEIASAYSPQIIDPTTTTFAEWSKIEVNFTVSGLATDKAAE